MPPRSRSQWSFLAFLLGLAALCGQPGCGQNRSLPPLPEYAEPLPAFCVPAAANPASRTELMQARDRIIGQAGQLAKLLALDLALKEPATAVRHFHSHPGSLGPPVRFLAGVALLRAGKADPDLLTGDAMLDEARAMFDGFSGPEREDPALQVHAARIALETGDYTAALNALRDSIPGSETLEPRLLDVSSRNPGLWGDLLAFAATSRDPQWRDELYRHSPRSLVLAGDAVVDSLWALPPGAAGRSRLEARIRKLIAVAPRPMSGVVQRMDRWREQSTEPVSREVQGTRARLRNLVRDREQWPRALALAEATIPKAVAQKLYFEAADLSMAAYYIRSYSGPNFRPEAVQAARNHVKYARLAADPLYESIGWVNLATALSSAGQIEPARQALSRSLDLALKYGFDSSEYTPRYASHLEWAGQPHAAYAVRDSFYRELRAGGRIKPQSQLGAMATEALAFGDSTMAVRLSSRLLELGSDDYTVMHAALATRFRAGGFRDPRVRKRLLSEIERMRQSGNHQSEGAMIRLLADGFEALGEPARALEEYRKAWSILSKQPRYKRRWETEAAFARALWRAGSPDEALPHARAAWQAALETFDEWRGDISRSSSLYEARDCADLLVDLYIDSGADLAAYTVDEQSRQLKGAASHTDGRPRPRAGELILKIRPRPETLLIWATDSDSTRAVVLHRPPAALEQEWITSRSGLSRFRELADTWGELLLRPFAPRLATHTAVRLVVDGSLRNLPLEFLRHEGQWLIETHSVLRAVSCKPDKRDMDFSRPALWVGNASPGNAASTLEMAEAEVRQLHARYGGRLMTDAEDGEIIAALSDAPSVLHIATHTGTDEYGTGYLELWQDGAPVRIDAPTLLGWPLDRLSLVNLAACRSLRGDGGAAELTSLAAAALAAGARSVLGTLWDVPDLDTAEFMQEFYATLWSGNPALADPSSALRSVQLRWLRDKRPGPLWWTGLVTLER